MPRIRTIKPEFFKHEALFEAEIETGLPLRLAYIGLWTQCDREGRFLWRPRPLKLDILPYDEVDFARVLDALATRGFIVKYVSEGREIGWVPSFPRHQVINHRESASQLPPPPENIGEFDASVTRAPRVDHAAWGEGKGREGKGTVEPYGSTLSEPSVADPARSGAKKDKRTYPPEFEAAWLAYPRTPNMSKAEALPAWNKLTAAERAQVLPSVAGYRAYLATKPDLEVIHFCRYLSKRRFESFASAGVTELETPAQWQKRLGHARTRLEWFPAKWGPVPGAEDCRVPADLLQSGDGDGWRETSAA